MKKLVFAGQVFSLIAMFPILEFDTLFTLHPLKVNASGGCTLNFKKVVGRKPLAKFAGSYYF